MSNNLTSAPPTVTVNHTCPHCGGKLAVASSTAERALQPNIVVNVEISPFLRNRSGVHDVNFYY